MNTTSRNGKVKLTKYSHGAGCGCKISPALLDEILKRPDKTKEFKHLLVGNDTKDDAAVFQVDDKKAVISTTDFFMPIVDDPFDFGRIAATNALSDVYAMGGKPIMALSLLGWPVDKLPPEVAGHVIEGARQTCHEAGIPLAGGHSIDTPEPIFGLAVTGMIDCDKIVQNSGAGKGCLLYLTKPLGIGILTTAEKKGILREEDQGLATQWMLKPNTLGVQLAGMEGVRAMTDVTGFGLLGHLIEMCEASDLSAEVISHEVPVIEEVTRYVTMGSIPGGTERNFTSYGHKINHLTDEQKDLLCDPQTSGGLLIAVNPASEKKFTQLTKKEGFELAPFGTLKPMSEHVIVVK